MPVSNDKPPEGPVAVFPNDDRRRTCEEKSCKRSADLHVKLGSPPTGKGHYWCMAEHWIQARSVLITRKGQNPLRGRRNRPHLRATTIDTPAPNPMRGVSEPRAIVALGVWIPQRSGNPLSPKTY